jgi:hypothetical protein
MRSFILSLSLVTALAGCPTQEQTPTSVAPATPEDDLGECTLDTPEAASVTAPTTTTPALRPPTPPVVVTATPAVATTPAAPAATGTSTTR